MKEVDLCFEDASFGELCRSTFPDEAYASLDEWVEAMASDDTGDEVLPAKRHAAISPAYARKARS